MFRKDDKGLVLICSSCGFDSRKESMPVEFGKIELRPADDIYIPICPICEADASFFTRDQALVDDLINSLSKR